MLQRPRRETQPAHSSFLWRKEMTKKFVAAALRELA
jgi:hypothetical protein